MLFLNLRLLVESCGTLTAQNCRDIGAVVFLENLMEFSWLSEDGLGAGYVFFVGTLIM